MKKKLLFSLLLGFAFAWMNEMYAAEVAAPVVAAEPVASKMSEKTAKSIAKHTKRTRSAHAEPATRASVEPAAPKMSKKTAKSIDDYVNKTRSARRIALPAAPAAHETAAASAA